MEIAYLRKVIGQFYWTGHVTYDGEWIVDLENYAMGPIYITRGVGRGVSYLVARDRAIENSGRAEGDWSRLLPELDEMVYEATRYQVPEIS